MTLENSRFLVSNKAKILILLLLIILPPIFIFVSREMFEANYLTSSIYKIIFLTPLFYRLWIERKSLKQSILEGISFENFKKNILKLFVFGAFLAGIYLASFFIFRSHIDLGFIGEKLKELANINIENIIFIGLYIIIINSFLEEFFWRGFVFEKLRKFLRPWMAYLISGIAFSFHHMVFYYNWFNPGFFILVTFGLFMYAMILNYIFEKYRDLLSCWLVHSLSDIVQISIGVMILSSL